MSALKRYPRGVLEPQSAPQPVTLADLLARVYPDPAPWLTAEGFARYHHEDVPALDDDALADEIQLARIRRGVEYMTRQRPSPWLYERIKRLEAEAARRRRTPSR